MATYTIDKFTYNNNTYNLQDAGALQLTGGQVTGPVSFGDAVTIDEATVGDLLVTGAASFTNTINGYTLADQTISSNSTHGSIPTSKAVYDYLNVNSGVTSLTTAEGAYSALSAATGAVTLNIPTTTNHLANTSGFITNADTPFIFGTGTHSAILQGSTNSQASGQLAVAIGGGNEASGDYSFAGGSVNTAAFGHGNQASGISSLAFGLSNIASGNYSSSFGQNSTASGSISTSFGDRTIATGRTSIAIGHFNIADSTVTSNNLEGTKAFIIGNGTDDNTRSNAFSVDWDGTVTAAGKITVGAAPVNDMDVATKVYVDNHGTVTQSVVSTDAWKKVLLHNADLTGAGLTTTTPINDEVQATRHIEVNPSLGILRANNLYVTANSSSATALNAGIDFTAAASDGSITKYAHIGNSALGLLGLYSIGNIALRPSWSQGSSTTTGISIDTTTITPAEDDKISLGTSSAGFQNLYLTGQGNATTFKGTNIIASASSNNLTAGAGFEIYNSTPALRAFIRAGANSTLIAGTARVNISPSVDTADNGVSITSTSFAPYASSNTISLGTSSKPFTTLYVSDPQATAHNLNLLYAGRQTGNNYTIASGDDLNTYTTPGSYYSPRSAITNSLSNSPITGRGFVLHVLGGYSTGDTYQIAITYGDNQIYYRSTSSTSANSAWTPWHQIGNNADHGIAFGSCSTAAATTAKTATITDFQLQKFGIVMIAFTNSVPAGATLNINETGAKAIYHKGATIQNNVIQAGDQATFMYNGSSYLLLSRDTNSSVTIVRW